MFAAVAHAPLYSAFALTCIGGSELRARSWSSQGIVKIACYVCHLLPALHLRVSLRQPVRGLVAARLRQVILTVLAAVHAARRHSGLIEGGGVFEVRLRSRQGVGMLDPQAYSGPNIRQLVLQRSQATQQLRVAGN